jgi:hypothetical protein
MAFLDHFKTTLTKARMHRFGSGKYKGMTLEQVGSTHPGLWHLDHLLSLAEQEGRLNTPLGKALKVFMAQEDVQKELDGMAEHVDDILDRCLEEDGLHGWE